MSGNLRELKLWNQMNYSEENYTQVHSILYKLKFITFEVNRKFLFAVDLQGVPDILNTLFACFARVSTLPAGNDSG